METVCSSLDTSNYTPGKPSPYCWEVCVFSWEVRESIVLVPNHSGLVLGVGFGCSANIFSYCGRESAEGCRVQRVFLVIGVSCITFEKDL